MSPTQDLLRACSWRCEKILRARRGFTCVLWIAETGNNCRETWETECDNAPAEASDTEILNKLAEEMREVLRERRAVRFAVGYPARRTTEINPIETPAADWKCPPPIRRAGVVIAVDVH